jgi:hypothetical protein
VIAIAHKGFAPAGDDAVVESRLASSKVEYALLCLARLAGGQVAR